MHTGMKRAAQDAEEKLGVDTTLIMCFLRHLSAEDAMKTLDLVRVGTAAIPLTRNPMGFLWPKQRSMRCVMGTELSFAAHQRLTGLLSSLFSFNVSPGGSEGQRSKSRTMQWLCGQEHTAPLHAYHQSSVWYSVVDGYLQSTGVRNVQLLNSLLGVCFMLPSS